MAFYLTESEDFKNKQKEGYVMPFEEIVAMMERDGKLRHE